MVRWPNVQTIFIQEARDQLRDRRTLFMVFVLPILLYPLLGIGMARLSEAFQDQTRRVVIVGCEHLAAASAANPEAPPLLDETGSRFNPSLFDNPDDAARLDVLCDDDPSWHDPTHRRERLRGGDADAVVLIPSDLADTLRQQRRVAIPIAYDSADEKSQLTYFRITRLLEAWNLAIVEQRRVAEGRPEGSTDPVRPDAQDVATRTEAGSSVWARIFPFLLVLMSLTGAFYPAVDLCAGEKERGTMETLLISPASRAEIVLGKFFVVFCASIATALLNLASMGATAFALAAQFNQAPMRLRPSATGAAALLAAPSPVSLGWMIALLIPLAAFFSALCLALAIVARSMKEGQYYMTPLYLICLPLACLPLVPGIQLDPFTSLLPVTGVSLLLRALMQGDYASASQYFPLVFTPLVLCGLLAIRWAIDQFKSESVLFREAEHFDLVGWLRHLWRDKPQTPPAGMAVLCYALMLVAYWFLAPFFPVSGWSLVLMQVLVILGPPVALALLLTRDPIRTLRLRATRPADLALAGLLALTLFPMVNELRVWVDALFPMPEAVRQALERFKDLIPDPATAFLLLALTPALCEEVAFRGYILTSLERSYRPAWAIGLSALLFGFMHVLLSLFQQLFNATLLGLVLGLIAIRTRSLFPCIVFHLVNNGLAVGVGALTSAPWAGRLFRDPAQALFHGPITLLTTALAAVLVMRLAGQPLRGRSVSAVSSPNPERIRTS
ncbi:MAG: sodium extrusion protein NatB [Isosphaeraceae bacterium]|jgi:sodium transport system permease protein|nr:MAG: sodium extrusion protein NatB [Isosphaeraceae bacterium]